MMSSANNTDRLTLPPFPGNILLNERQVVQVKLDETVYNKKKQHKKPSLHATAAEGDC